MFSLRSDWCSWDLWVPCLARAGSHAQASLLSCLAPLVIRTLLQTEHFFPWYLTTSDFASQSDTSLTILPNLSPTTFLRSCDSENVPHQCLQCSSRILLLFDICHISSFVTQITSPLSILGEHFHLLLKHFGGSFPAQMFFKMGTKSCHGCSPARMFYCSCPRFS